MKPKKNPDDELLKKLLEQVHERREKDHEEFSDLTCFAAIKLLIACTFGK